MTPISEQEPRSQVDLEKASIDVSVVLCTLNNASRLRTTLSHLSRCETGPELSWEIVAVDNGSLDATADVIRSFSEHGAVRYGSEPTPGVSRGRNEGVAMARGELLIFTDDDVEVPPEWVSVYWQAYKKHGPDCYFGGPVVSDFEGRPPSEDLLPFAPASVRGLDWGNEERPLASGEYLIGANWACARSAVVEAGGFDARVGPNSGFSAACVGEETLLMEELSRQGLRGWYLPQAVIKHWVPTLKTTRRHIGARLQASSSLRVVCSADGFEGPRILGIPRWLYRQLATDFIRLCGTVWNRGASAKAYIKLRQTIGTMMGWRARGRGRDLEASSTARVAPD